MLACPVCGETNPVRARFCLGCGNALDDGETVQELRRSVSIIFADLVGSTALGEALDAEALRYVTGRYFDTMRMAIERHEGTVEKFIGDAVVALFGVPRVREDDALRAVRAAADMRASLAPLNDELQRDLAVTLEIRIGVNTGEVIIGERRAGGSLATGDAVNLAARLEQVAKPGEILIGEGTRRIVRDLVTLEPVEPLEVKGKTGTVTAWRLLEIEPPQETSEDTALGTFVGRDSQLRLLEDAFRRVEVERTSQLVTVLGAAGMGKSRLAEEFIATRSDATVLIGHCLSYGQGATYWPLREAVLHAANLTGDESIEVTAAALTAVLGDAPDAANVVTRLLALVALNRNEAVPEDVPWAVRTFLERLARDQPVVLVVDDLHWAEPGLLDVIEHIADWSRDAPIMLLGLARPEFYESRPTWGGGKLNATTMLLPALDDVAAVSLVQKHDLPDEVRDRIVHAAGGNPLFVQQLVAMLVDDGQAALDDGIATWIGGSPANVALTLPPTVSALLTARIDRLPDAERTILGAAAVIGTVFYVEGVATLTGTPSPQVRQVLEELVRKDLLRATVSDLPALSAYRFLHVLVRDAAYDGLAKSNRARWHEQLGDWLAGLGSDVVPDEIVGHHLAAAWEYQQQLGPATDQTRELANRAARRLAAASRRLDVSDVAAAASLLRRAVDLVAADDPDRMEWMLSLAMQQFELGEIDHARQTLGVVSDAEDSRQALLAGVLMCRSNALTADYHVDANEAFVRDALRWFQEWGDDRGLAHTYLVKADIESFRGRTSVAADLLALALKHGERAGDAACVARARSLLGIFLLFGPVPAEEVIESLDRMVVASGGDPRVRAEAEQVTCVLHAMRGRFEQARALGADARQHLADVGHTLFLANLAQSTGHIEELAGDLDAAEAEYRRSCADLDALGESSYFSTVAGLHGRLLVRRGKLAEAEVALELARRHGSPDDVTTQSLVQQIAGLLAAAAGEADLARGYVAEGVRLENGDQGPDGAGEACLAAADVERMLGDTDAERRHLRAAQSLFEAKGNIVRAAEIIERLGR